MNSKDNHLIAFSPETGRLLSSPVFDYFRAAVREAYGSDMETRVTRYMTKRITEMDEGEPGSKMAVTLDRYVNPVIAYEQALEHEGFTQKEAVDFATATWRSFVEAGGIEE